MQRHWVSLCWGVALLASGQAPAAEHSATPLVRSMREARYSDGFEIRISLETTKPGSALVERIRLAMIGDAGSERRRLVIRPVSPDSLRTSVLVAVADAADGHVEEHAKHVDEATGGTPVDSMGPLFGTALSSWDLMTPWWDWVDQTVQAARSIDGHGCVEIASRAPSTDSGAVREVVSCVDAAEGLAWRTRLLDRRGLELRVIQVSRAMRTQAGRSVAKSAVITDRDGVVTRLDAYAGDEHYRIAPDTFSLHPTTESTGR